MRIEKLRFKNINSLSGEWEIDLTDPAYLSGGVFAIIGDTGSGKTSILDAICLALYGETPRISISGSSNEVMTRTAGECFSEVLFSCEKGRFLCRWEQKRARGRADGRLQGVQHRIAKMTEAGEGKPIGQTMSKNRDKIIEITGMTFDEFTRSVMLAQGQFAAFLKAKPDERSPILEKITGTGIYTRISKAVHERTSREKGKLEELNSSVQAYPVKPADEVAALKTELSGNQEKEEVLVKQRSKVNEALQWYKAMADLEKDISTLLWQDQEHQLAVKQFEPKQVELDLALRAVGIDADFSAFDANRSLKNRLIKKLKQLNDVEIPEKTVARANALSEQQKAEDALSKARTTVAENTPLFDEIKALDKQIGECQAQVFAAKAKADAEKEKLRALEKEKVKSEKGFAKAVKSIDEMETWRDENAASEGLIASFSKIKVQFDGLVGIQKAIAVKEDERKAAVTWKSEVVKKQQVAKADLTGKSKVKGSAEQALEKTVDDLKKHLEGRTIDTLRAERESLVEKRHQQELFASFKEHRLSLKPGMPCPCCGSTDHPFVSDGIPETVEVKSMIDALDQRIALAVELESARQEIKAALSEANNSFIQAESGKQVADEQVRQATENLSRLEKELDALALKYGEEGNRILESINPFGYTEMPKDAKGCLDGLAKRLKEWQEKDQAYKQTVSKRDAFAGQISVAEVRLEIQQTVFNENNSEYNKLKDKFKAICFDRVGKFGDRNPVIEAEKLNAAVESAETALGQKQADLQEKDKALTVLKAQRQAKVDEFGQVAKDSQALAERFLSALNKMGFKDEADYLSARRSQEDRDALSEASKTIKEKGLEIRTNLKSKRQVLADEKAKNLTEISPSKLSEKHDQLEVEIRALTTRRGEINAELRSDNENREKRKAIQSRIDAQNKVYEDWDSLRGLIGHHDGKEFRNFVQSLTFEYVVSHANDQLQKMDGRYLLKPDKENGLDLMVVDSWQGGVERTIKNLSGGESFIVSLALALGLSEMTGRRDRIDSLFLDEGFGTLDEETLNTAMNTLSELNRGGRLIGIISHVEALKERITTKIEVIKGGDGTSLLQGPGCQKLS